MDLINNLLQHNAPLKRIVVPGAQVDGALDLNAEDIGEVFDSDNFKPAEEDYSYAQVYQQREAALYTEASKHFHDEGHASDTLTEITSANTITSEAKRLHQEESLRVYGKFSFKSVRSQSLTIDSYREQIVSMLSTNEVLIIEGPTGCGKTTQVPQFILDDCRTNNQPCNVVVTQPRRIAAISVAQRVCEERNWGLGTVCGYQVGLERNMSPDTVLHYVTTGVLLQKLIAQKSLNEFTHIIIDEVHERDQHVDFLLLVVRKFLFLHPSSVKVILMSATFDTDEFAHYFRNFSGSKTIPAPIIRITKPGVFTTTIHYLDQLVKAVHLPIAEFVHDKPVIGKHTFDAFTFVVRAFDRLDKKRTKSEEEEGTIGSVLVFLPGIYEIEEAYAKLKEYMNNHIDMTDFATKWEILPLHSSITVEEQRKVFNLAKPGYRKIILATNIAESSITVPDITYVIDFCLTKTLVVDPLTKYQSLVLQWASHVNCKQRAGRVGRLSDGKVYRLVPRDFYEKEMPETIPPEILRAPLDQLVLSAKMLALNEPPEAILSLALNPPDLKNIESTIWLLKECGALTLKCRGRVTRSDGDLTFLGRVMAHLPLDVHLSKFIVLGQIFSCLKDAIIMASGCSLNKIFSTPFQERLKAYSNKLMWSDGSCSDLIALLNLYKVWEQNKRRNAFATGSGERGWIEQNYLSARALCEWQCLVKEITDRLMRLGIRETSGQGRVRLTSLESPLVLKVVMCGAFYPNYFIRTANAGQVDEREAVRILSGKDPYRTVYMTNMNRDQPGQLYVNSIKKYINCETDLCVTFDKSQKVFIQFPMDRLLSTVNLGQHQAVVGIPGKISQEVYKAIRKRQLGINCIIPVLPLKEAWKHMEKLSEKEKPAVKGKSCLDSEERSIIPQLDQEYVQIIITEMIDAGHFWAQNNDDMTQQNLFFLQNMLNNTTSKLKEIPENTKVKVGQLYAARYVVDNLYYRCRVLHIRPSRKTSIAQVLFIDFGNTQGVDVRDLRCLPDAVKLKQPQAMECVLAEIQPSFTLNPRGLWSDVANKVFRESTENIVLFGKVYSVVNNVVHLELYKTRSKQNISLNQWLVDKGYAQPAEESFLSKDNHEKRKLYRNTEHSGMPVESEESNMENADLCEIESPNASECHEKIHLKGPFSPLEMRVYGITHSSLGKEVVIEGTSVNGVLLDAEPQDPHTRLIVAAYIGQNAGGNRLTLRNTTAMPNIHGFTTLVSLIFCPSMEPKPMADGSRLASVLCGLGAHENTSVPLYAQHDFVLNLDTELNNSELSEINELRYWMNEALDTMACLYENVISPRSSMEKCQFEVKDRLFKLLKIKRKSVEKASVKFENMWNKTLFDSDIMTPTYVSDTGNEIWPLHWTIKINFIDETEQKLKRNLLQLTDIAQRLTPMVVGVRCEFCDCSFVLLSELRLHIISEMHKKNVEKSGLKH